MCCKACVKYLNSWYSISIVHNSDRNFLICNISGKWVIDKRCLHCCRARKDRCRLGSGPADDLFLQPGHYVESLSDKKVLDVAIGPVHCLAVTDGGDVYSWGKNDLGQLGDLSQGSQTEPALVTSLETKNIVGATCGPAQVNHFTCLPVSFYRVFVFRT